MIVAKGLDGVSSLSLDDMLRDSLALGFAKDSEFTQVFNVVLLELKQEGILDDLTYKWLRKRPNTSGHGRQQASAIVLGFENLIFPFLCLACGIASGVVIAFIERMQRKVW